MLGADQGACEDDGIGEDMTNVHGKLMAILRLIQSCHDMSGV